MARGFNNRVGHAKEGMKKSVEKQMRIEDMSQQELAELMGITQQALSYKFKRNSYSFDDVYNFFRFLHFEDEDILKIFK